MKSENQYVLYMMDKLQPHGPIRARAMFGGYGVYYLETMLGVIVENELYFRIDEATKKEFEKYDSKPFTYQMKDKLVTLPYLTVPEEILENSDQLPLWIERAYQTALKHKKPKKKKSN